MTGSGDAPGHLNELSSDIDTLSENLLETYTNLLHLERVLRCQQQESAAPDGPRVGREPAAAEQRWRRRRRSFQLAGPGDGVSELSGPPAPDGRPRTDTDTTGLERRVSELEADVRRIDQEKEEIRIKYTAVLKRLRRLQLSSSENWDAKSPTSAGGVSRSPEVRRWPSSAAGRRSTAHSACSESGRSSSGSRPASPPGTTGTLPPAPAPGEAASAGRVPPPVNGLYRHDEGSETPPPLPLTPSLPPHLPSLQAPEPPPLSQADRRRLSETSCLQSGTETNSETRGDGSSVGGRKSRSSGVRGGSPLDPAAGTGTSCGSRASSSSGEVKGSSVLRSTRMDSEAGATVPADSAFEEGHHVQETTGVTSPFLPSESDSDFPAGVSSCDREGHSCTVSSAHPGISSASHGIGSPQPGSVRPGSARPGSSRSIPAGFGRPVLPGSRASSSSAPNPAPAFNRSTSHPGGRSRWGSTPRGESNSKSPVEESRAGRSRRSAPEEVPVGDGSRQAVEDQIDFARHCGREFSSTRQSGIDSSGEVATEHLTEHPDGSPVPSENSGTAQESTSVDVPGHSSPPRFYPPRAASPEEDSVPHGPDGDSGDIYTGAGGATCGSFAAWPSGGGAGSAPLMSPLVLFARPSSPPGGLKSLCEVADTGTQTEVEEGGDTETVAALEVTIRRKDSVIDSMKTSLAKVEAQLVATQQQLQTIETDVLQRLAGAEQTWRRKRRQLQLDLAGERAVSQTLHAVEADLGEQLRRCRRRCAELEDGLADRTERGLAAGRGSVTRRRRRSRRLAALCHQLAEHVGRLLAAQTRLTGELLSTLQQLFGLFTAQSPVVPPPCHEATLATLPLWLPWLAAEARLACQDRQHRHLEPVSPPEALPSPPPGGAPPHLAALVSQVWEDIERLRGLDLEEPGGQGEGQGGEGIPPVGDGLE